MTIETILKEQLKRQSPPRGFSGRVMARVTRSQATPERSRWDLRFMRIAAAVALTTGALWMSLQATQSHQREVSARDAKAQLLLAMRISSVKAAEARDGVLRINER